MTITFLLSFFLLDLNVNDTIHAYILTYIYIYHTLILLRAQIIYKMMHIILIFEEVKINQQKLFSIIFTNSLKSILPSPFSSNFLIIFLQFLSDASLKPKTARTL